MIHFSHDISHVVYNVAVSIQLQMFTPRRIYEQQVEKDAIKINCALVLDPLRVLLGAEDGLMMFDCNEEVPLKLGERKVTYLERCENIIVYMGMPCRRSNYLS